jgi:hypothetical protein
MAAYDNDENAQNPACVVVINVLWCHSMWKDEYQSCSGE